MSVSRGPVPVYIALLAFTAAVLWTPFAMAQQRVPLTIADHLDATIWPNSGCDRVMGFVSKDISTTIVRTQYIIGGRR